MKQHSMKTRLATALAGTIVSAVIITGGGLVTPAPAHAATCTSYTYSLGGRSDCIKHIQVILNSTWWVWTGSRFSLPKLAVDGAFGAKTRDAVRVFQYESVQGGRPYLADDGVVGPATWRELCFVGKQVASGAARAAGC